MVQAFGPAGLNQAAEAATAAEIVADARPSANTFYQLAVFAYAAGQTRKGDLASAKALELTPKDQRAALKERLDAAKTQGASAGAQAGTAGAGNDHRRLRSPTPVRGPRERGDERRSDHLALSIAPGR